MTGARWSGKGEEAQIRAQLLDPHGTPTCPRCGGGLDQQSIPPRSDVSYVRDRLLFLCSRCGVRWTVDRPRPPAGE